jgi:hypothetical protein
VFLHFLDIQAANFDPLSCVGCTKLFGKIVAQLQYGAHCEKYVVDVDHDETKEICRVGFPYKQPCQLKEKKVKFSIAAIDVILSRTSPPHSCTEGDILQILLRIISISRPLAAL